MNPQPLIDALTPDADGLIPVIAQQFDTGEVLMLAWMNREAIEATLSTGHAHYWSRSRGKLWRKGETSGNTLLVVDMDLDCDGDALLIRARPAGPTCHTGAVSCFGGTPDRSFAELDALWAVIESRAAERPPDSYTTSLLDGGVDDLVLDIGDVHHEPHFESTPRQIAANHVECHRLATVAHVGRGLHSWAAGVDADFAWGTGVERLQGAAEGVVDAYHE